MLQFSVSRLKTAPVLQNLAFTMPTGNLVKFRPFNKFRVESGITRLSFKFTIQQSPEIM